MSDMTMEEREERDRLQKAEIMRKQDEARAAAEAERREHLSALELEAVQRQDELGALLGLLDDAEQRQVRMHAYMHVLNSDWGSPSDLQAHVDNITLRLARFMVEGKV